MSTNDAIKAREKWREIEAQKAVLEGKLLQLLKHKDAEPEHLVDAHKAYIHVCEVYAQAKEALMIKYPDTGGVHVWPWNKRG